VRANTAKTYNSNDLEMYFSNLSPRIPPTTAPAIEIVDGGVVRNNVSFGALAFAFNGEANLDLSLAIGLGESCQVVAVTAVFIG
jgi:hypothetical protein